MPAPRELELLELQYERLFDERRRIRDFYGVTLAEFGGRQMLWIGVDVPDELARELSAETSIERCRALLPTDLPFRTNINYVVEDDVAPPAIEAQIVRSDAPLPAALRDANPGNWEPVEWDELLDGKLGPWTIAIDGGRVASLCHTPCVPRARAVEAGVWTHADFRGRGYAAAVTSAWIALMRPSYDYIFYSTTVDNRSSQQVSRRLGLRTIGTTSRLGRGKRDDDDNVHPLSVLRDHVIASRE